MAQRMDHRILTAEELAAALEERWGDPAQVVAHGYHLVVALGRRVEELERRWNDAAALRRRLDELTGPAVSYVAAVAAVHLVGTAAWAAFDLLT